MPRLLSVQVIAEGDGWTVGQASRPASRLHVAEAEAVPAALLALSERLRLPRVPWALGPTAAARHGRRQFAIWQVTGDRWHAVTIGERATPLLIESMTGPYLLWRGGWQCGGADNEAGAIGLALVILLERAGLPALRG